MGHVPVPPPPWLLTIDQQIAMLEPRLALRTSRFGWRRRDAANACRRLILLREHDLFGLHDVEHAGRKVVAPPKSSGVLVSTP